MAALTEPVYGKLLSRIRPRVIKTAAENERAIAELEALDTLGRPLTREEQALAELLTVLIRQFEESKYPLGHADPLDALRELMEARQVRQRDLIPVFGASSVVSDVLARETRHQQSPRAEVGGILPGAGECFYLKRGGEGRAGRFSRSEGLRKRSVYSRASPRVWPCHGELPPDSADVVFDVRVWTSARARRGFAAFRRIGWQHFYFAIATCAFVRLFVKRSTGTMDVLK